MIRFVAVLLLFGLAFGQRKDVVYEDCGSPAKVTSVQLEPCDSDPCVIKRGSKVKIHFTLVSDQDSATARLDARMNVFGLKIPIPGLKKDMCDGVVQCPIVKGNTYTGVLEADVPWFAPAMKSQVELKLVGDKGVSICTRSNVVVQ
ncbi:mite group 2 allergen-like Ixo r 2 [Dermacentor silvarum]|uniref:mite group 2 allergen-like Ixo r 2 n=1 Tax=Dermacentor silvarum TaxID=543639 RepID=UPI001896BD43|nr:mite group 2 allergen-like Ixo r 2 [Dermacentor silvarum]